MPLLLLLLDACCSLRRRALVKSDVDEREQCERQSRQRRHATRGAPDCCRDCGGAGRRVRGCVRSRRLFRHVSYLRRYCCRRCRRGGPLTQN